MGARTPCTLLRLHPLRPLTFSASDGGWGRQGLKAASLALVFGLLWRSQVVQALVYHGNDHHVKILLESSSCHCSIPGSQFVWNLAVPRMLFEKLSICERRN